MLCKQVVSHYKGKKKADVKGQEVPLSQRDSIQQAIPTEYYEQLICSHDPFANKCESTSKTVSASEKRKYFLTMHSLLSLYWWKSYTTLMSVAREQKQPRTVCVFEEMNHVC